MKLLQSLIDKGLITNELRNEQYHLLQYNDKYFRIIKNKYEIKEGFEFEKNIENFKNILSNEKDEEEIQRISRVRTKSRIRELALCNNFEYFGTITVNGYFCNRYELTDCQNKLKKLLKKIKRNNKDFKYLIITEKHLDGAFHFHGLFSGLDLFCNEYGYWENKELSELGYNSFSPIRDYNKCCNYIMKYITKDCVRNSHNQIFIRSKGLRVATNEKINKPDFDIEWKYENDYCSIYDINLDKITEYDKMLLTYLISQFKS